MNTKQNKTLSTITASVLISFVWMFISINKTTVILYNLVYYIFIKMLLSIIEILLFDYSNKPPFDKKYNTEYFIFRELFLNIGRVLGYVILLFVGFSRDMEYLKILFLCTTIALLVVIYLTKKIGKEAIKKFQKDNSIILTFFNLYFR